MKIGMWLMAMCEPLIAKILLGLGFSVVSIVGVEVAVNAIKTQVIANMNSMPAVWLEFALYLWLGKALGILFGAMATKMSLWAIQNATSLLGRSPQ